MKVANMLHWKMLERNMETGISVQGEISHGLRNLKIIRKEKDIRLKNMGWKPCEKQLRSHIIYNLYMRIRDIWI